MAVTLTFLPFRGHATWGSWISDLANWLTDVHATYAGPAWELIEADDGTNRDVPTGTTTADLPPFNAWSSLATSPPAVGSWICLQSLPGAIEPSNTFQVLFYVRTTAVVEAYLFVLSDFATGGGSTGGTLPVVPSTASSFTNMTKEDDQWEVHFATADQSVLQMGIIRQNDDPDANRWWYVGELDVPAAIGGSGTNINQYPFVIKNSDDARVPASTSTFEWRMRQPGNVNAEISSSRAFVMQTDINQFEIGTDDFSFQTMEGHLSFMPFGLFFEGSGVGFPGYLRHVFTADGTMCVSWRFSDGKDFFLLNGGSFRAALAINWDGASGLDLGNAENGGGPPA